MDPKDLYPNYDKDDKDPYHSDQDSQSQQYGYHKPGRAITSMILGICSVSLWFYPFITSIPCMIMGFIAIRMANNADGRTDPKYTGFLKAGRITGIIGLIISALFTIFMALLVRNGRFSEFLTEFMKYTGTY